MFQKNISVVVFWIYSTDCRKWIILYFILHKNEIFSCNHCRNFISSHSSLCCKPKVAAFNTDWIVSDDYMIVYLEREKNVEGFIVAEIKTFVGT
jgi:hypothetical protein